MIGADSENCSHGRLRICLIDAENLRTVSLLGQERLQNLLSKGWRFAQLRRGSQFCHGQCMTCCFIDFYVWLGSTFSPQRNLLISEFSRLGIADQMYSWMDISNRTVVKGYFGSSESKMSHWNCFIFKMEIITKKRVSHPLEIKAFDVLKRWYWTMVEWSRNVEMQQQRLCKHTLMYCSREWNVGLVRNLCALNNILIVPFL